MKRPTRFVLQFPNTHDKSRFSITCSLRQVRLSIEVQNFQYIRTVFVPSAAAAFRLFLAPKCSSLNGWLDGFLQTGAPLAVCCDLPRISSSNASIQYTLFPISAHSTTLCKYKKLLLNNHIRRPAASQRQLILLPTSAPDPEAQIIRPNCLHARSCSSFSLASPDYISTCPVASPQRRRRALELVSGQRQ
jgi:hypothetical protein